jgi:hypothetical protein
MIRAVRTRLGILSMLTASSMVFGCGSDGDKGNGAEGGKGGIPTGEESLNLTFSPMYSAYDGEHEFKVPVIVVDPPSKITFRPLDPSMVDVSRTGDASAMLTMKKAGKTTIIAEAEDGTWGKSELHITQAQKGDWDLGKDRYENGVEAFMTPDGGFQLPNFDGGFPNLADSGIRFEDGSIIFPDGGLGGFPRPDGGFMAPMANPESACTFCHKPDGQQMQGLGGGLLNIDVEHTPQQIGGYSDEDLLKIFTMGQKPEGVPMRIAMGERLANTWRMTHQWQMTEDEQRGIIVYVRGLEPKTQGEVDFLGGLLRGDGGIFSGLFGDGGFRLPPGLFGDGGFNFGNRNDAGTTPAPAADAETPATGDDAATADDAATPAPAADASSQEMDAGAG